MNLLKKKRLVARTLNVGMQRIAFNTERLDEIKEAITKQDIRELKASGAIVIKQIKGRRTAVKRKTRRRLGSKKLTPRLRKRHYMVLTRKLRNYLFSLRKRGLLPKELHLQLRREIRAKTFKSLAQIKEKITGVKKWKYQEEEDLKERQIM